MGIGRLRVVLLGACLLVGGCQLFGARPPVGGDPPQPGQPMPAGPIVARGELDGVSWELRAARDAEGDVCLQMIVLRTGSTTCGTPGDDVIQTWGAGGGMGSPAAAQGLVGPTVARVRVEARTAGGAATTREVNTISLAHLDTSVRAFAVVFPPDYSSAFVLEALDNEGNVLERTGSSSPP